MHFQNINREAAIHSVGNTTNICFQAGWDMKLNRANRGCRHNRGPQVMRRMMRGSGGGLSGEMARSSGINEKVDEKERLRAVKGGGWCEHRLTRGEKTSSVLERARRLYSGAQAGMAWRTLTIRG
jgi:hypothetical protein